MKIQYFVVTGCTKDAVAIFTYSGKLEKQQEIICGDGLKNKKLTLNSNQAFIEFVSDNQNEKSGFIFTYDTTKTRGMLY